MSPSNWKNDKISRNQPSKQDNRRQVGEWLYFIGLLTAIVGSLLLFSTKIPSTGWLLSGSGILISIALWLKGRTISRSTDSVRARRLDRLMFIGGLLFIVSGGFGAEGNSLWILLFAGGTVFSIYGIFAGSVANE